MLKFRYKMRHRNLPKGEGRGSGPAGRISRMRKLVTALVRHERIEGNHYYLDESRGYAERLIQEAMKHGDQSHYMMDMADYWLLEKDLIHKLFKVLVPRYSYYQTSYTNMHRLSTPYPGRGIPQAILELRGNPWPDVVPNHRDMRGTLSNVLLDEARKEYRRKKYEEVLRLKENANLDILDTPVPTDDSPESTDATDDSPESTDATDDSLESAEGNASVDSPESTDATDDSPESAEGNASVDAPESTDGNASVDSKTNDEVSQLSEKLEDLKVDKKTIPTDGTPV